MLGRIVSGVVDSMGPGRETGPVKVYHQPMSSSTGTVKSGPCRPIVHPD